MSVSVFPSSSIGGGDANGFSLVVGFSGNTTYNLGSPQAAGDYIITSALGDSSFDVYLTNESNANVGYTNTALVTASDSFTTVVVYGATANDLLAFEKKSATVPSTSGELEDGVAPFLTSATPATLASIDDSTTVTGGNFASDVEIVFTGQDDVDRAAKSIVRNSPTELIVTRPDAFPVEQEPFSMTATNAGIPNPSVTVNKLTDYFDPGSGVIWVTASLLPGLELGVAYSTTLEATDADGAGVTYALTAGALPTGFSLDGSSGEISGSASDAGTQPFTVTATDTGGNSSSREFEINVFNGDISYLIVAGGGAGQSRIGINNQDSAAGGGGGGYRSSVTGEASGGGASAESDLVVSANTNYAITVGAGGTWASDVATNGANSIFSTITSIGGGAAGRNNSGAAGSSGGGGGTPSFSGGVGTADQGFAGGSGGNRTGGGGGGGGGIGGNGGGFNFIANGGIGVTSAITGISIGRAGGGANFAGIGADGGGSGAGLSSSQPGASGAPNTGGGGSAGTTGGNGGSGVVILKYSDLLTITIGAGLASDTPAPSGGFKVTTITAGTGNVSWAA